MIGCTEFDDFGWGFTPDPTGELTTLPRSHRWILRGSKAREGKKRKRIGGEVEKGEETGRVKV